ncbi:unnamed protein product [Ilex paraguariensis]|uniref:Uncharacterized protein n=1 Tax=Ilex paraguariensis TaxID=185542 RepID=A0ABC8UC66_9AQUA
METRGKTSKASSMEEIVMNERRGQMVGMDNDVYGGSKAMLVTALGSGGALGRAAPGTGNTGMARAGECGRDGEGSDGIGEPSSWMQNSGALGTDKSDDDASGSALGAIRASLCETYYEGDDNGGKGDATSRGDAELAAIGDA